MVGKEGLEHLGARVQGALDEGPRALDELRRGRARFLEEVERRNAVATYRRQGRHTRLRPWLPLTLSVLGVAGLAGLWVRAGAITFQTGDRRHPELGDVIAATDERATPVLFSEGSALSVHEGGRIRVLALATRGATVLVEDGTVDASIAHRSARKTEWRFDAGPYRVTVLGTRFRMAFHSAARSLRVWTQEGRVAVTGECIDGTRYVSAGESIEAACSAPEAAAAPPAPGAGVAPAAALPSVPPSPPTDEAGAQIRAARSERWRGLLAGGQLLEGLRAAERANFDQACKTATAKELLALADAGRFFGPTRRAVTALQALRRRFPGSPDAGTAAFTLGRIVFEKHQAYAQASKWFETYLREQPSGPLMGDAFGRLMEARFRSGDGTGARASAEQYLRRFPEGPYASEARGILSK
jgi:TolA-binding protein